MKRVNTVLDSFRDDTAGKQIDAKQLWLRQRKLTPSRFRKLAKFLSDLPPEHFCMETWVKGASVPKMSCGTTACIAGWATTMDFAKKRAIKLFTQVFCPPTVAGIFASLPPSAMGWKTKEPVLTFYAALKMFFGLYDDEVEEIFFDITLSKAAAIKLLLEKAKLIESEPAPSQELYLRSLR